MKDNMLKQINEDIEGLHSIDKALYALEWMSRIYQAVDTPVFQLTIEEMVEVVAVLISPHTGVYQKKAARLILKNAIGAEATNDLIEGEAQIIDRGDPLVYRWKQAVLKRDKYTCQECRAIENLQVHHISPWADDIHNRVNIDNGITLCKECHSKKHPNLRALIKSTIHKEGGC